MRLVGRRRRFAGQMKSRRVGHARTKGAPTGTTHGFRVQWPRTRGDSAVPGQPARDGMTEDLHQQATPGLPMQDMGRPGGDGPVATSTMAASGPPAAANPDLAEPTPSPRRSNRWRVVGLAISLLALAACGWWAWPRAAEWLITVSTNDAY